MSASEPNVDPIVEAHKAAQAFAASIVHYDPAARKAESAARANANMAFMGRLYKGLSSPSAKAAHDVLAECIAKAGGKLFLLDGILFQGRTPKQIKEEASK